MVRTRPRGPRGEAGPRRHPRHRVRGAAAAARARRPRCRAAEPEHARRARARWPTAGTSTRRTRTRSPTAYRFLRTVEHRLQLVDELQVHDDPGVTRRADPPRPHDGIPRHRGRRRARPVLRRSRRGTRRRCGRSTSGSTSDRCSRRSRRCRRAPARPSCSAVPVPPRRGWRRSASPPPIARAPRSAS